MKERIPFSDGFIGNSCPVCGSFRITVHEQKNLYVDRNLSSGKEFVMKNGKMKPMSNKDKALAFDCSDSSSGGGCISYECRKCGWISELFVE